MKILVFGADGFIGKAVVASLVHDHEVYRAVRRESSNAQEVKVDLTDKSSIATALQTIQPEAIINCAGIVDVSADVNLNVRFTSNILDEILKNKLPVKSVVIIGSAGEYGALSEKDLPVSEDLSKRAGSGYGASKAEETRAALEYREKHGLPVVVARVFNPTGKNMHSKFLTSRIMSQLVDIAAGKRTALEVSRLDSMRDYISIKDIARAIKVLVENTPSQGVYNIGSGRATSNGELIDLIIKHSKIVKRPTIIETESDKEQTVASQADISRIKNEFGWSPKYSLEDSIKEITHDAYK